MFDLYSQLLHIRSNTIITFKFLYPEIFVVDYFIAIASLEPENQVLILCKFPEVIVNF